MNFLAEAKCSKCGATAQADTFEQARKKLDHAVGLGRGIKCGDSYNCVVEIGKKVASLIKEEISKEKNKQTSTSTTTNTTTKPTDSKATSTTSKNTTQSTTTPKTTSKPTTSQSTTE